MKKPFKKRIEDLLASIKEKKEIELSVLLDKLPEIKKNAKKFAMVQGLLRELECEIIDDISEEETDNLDNVEFNEKEAVEAEKELKEQFEKERKDAEAAAAAALRSASNRRMPRTTSREDRSPRVHRRT